MTNTHEVEIHKLERDAMTTDFSTDNKKRAIFRLELDHVIGELHDEIVKGRE